METKEVKRKDEKIKEPSVPIGFRGPKSLADKLEKMGNRGTVCCNITKQFIAVKQLSTKQDVDIPVTTAGGSILYGTDLGEGLHHITVKKGSDVIVSELTSVELANYIINLTEALNRSIKQEA